MDGGPEEDKTMMHAEALLEELMTVLLLLSAKCITAVD